MQPPRAVVLGARFGGVAVARALRRWYSPAALNLLIIDQSPDLTYRPGLPRVLDHPPVAVVQRAQMALDPFWRRQHIVCWHDTIVTVDPERRTVHTATHPPTSYDVLFIATGSDADWSQIPGLGPYRGGLSEGYLARHTGLRAHASPSGHWVFAAAPLIGTANWHPAPTVGWEWPLWEAAFRFEDFLRRTHRRHQVHITLVTPAQVLGEMAGPRAQAALHRIVRRRDIRVIRHAQYCQVHDHQLLLGGQTLAYDHAVWLPPTRGASWASPPLADAYGWIPTDAYGRHVDFPNIYAVGDVSAHPWPKSAQAATVQAHIAVRHWRHLQQPSRQIPYHPALQVLLATGGSQGLCLSGDTFWDGSQDRVWQGPWVAPAQRLLQLAYVLGLRSAAR